MITRNTQVFKKILIANRGEIAIRIARTARTMGIKTVAVYSDADRDALHVSHCNQAFLLGAAAASESYLRGDRIIEIALEADAEAIHPGYGFLSENAEFADACSKAGLLFIGPPAHAIRAMGSKSEAKALMQAANVPLVPGYHGDDQRDAILIQASIDTGYPQLIKASAGGGGKGMRIVESQEEFEPALISARREAKSSFGDEKVLIERYLVRPRHIEVQVFADQQGNAVHLFERDCSIQRRHQKIIEEAPAPNIDQTLRDKLTDAALRCTKSIGYEGAGTIEFLADESGDVFFMEMNTRLQVEHPVTELITGLDLVEWQLRIAAGEVLPLSQDEITISGHAIEARLYAEDTGSNFLPSSGCLSYIDFPLELKGLRFDSGVKSGDQIGVFYDPMMAKIIAYGDSREAATERLVSALRDTTVLGLESNLGFLKQVVNSQAFRAADLHTSFIDVNPELNADSGLSDSEFFNSTVQIIAAALLIPEFKSAPLDLLSPWNSLDGWRMNFPSAITINLEPKAGSQLLVARCLAGHWWIDNGVRNSSIRVEWLDANKARITIDDDTVTIPCHVADDSVEIQYFDNRYRFMIASHQFKQIGDSDSANSITAPMPGTLVAINITEGDEVKKGQSLAVLEAMKMEHNIVAPIDGTIVEILYKAGDQVDSDRPLMLLE